ncbi:CapA family protein [Actinomadura violacea]|uniref:CapA family protein n=1 Tax=Actinomadura violacea TaxID=2819934 RepID=A0ABS3S5K4_9ACTN|nr:CapA family protein [Actinomadura violacea]MBO2463495.1 CapA family protein [Actinomadura violacea]
MSTSRTTTFLLAAAVATTLAGCTADVSHAPSARRAAAARVPATITVAATGDFLLHQPLITQAAEDAAKSGHHGWDFVPMLSQLRPLIDTADIGICHMETPLATRSGPFEGYPAFNSPPQIVDAIRDLGYDTCSTASNHTLDQGDAGVRRTLGALDAASVKHTGSARGPAEAERADLLDVRGVKVAQLSYTYGTNGVPIPSNRPWLVNSGLDAPAILHAAARARAGGAAIVIVSLHWGEEYQHAPTGEQRALARRLLASPDVDLIIGDHVHVVQPFEQINGKWVAYGMGNQIANPIANSEDTHEGLVARFRLTRDAAGRWRAAASFVPTLVEPGPPIRLVDLPRALARGDLPAGTRARYRAALDRTTAAVRDLGPKVPVLDGPLPNSPASAEQLAGP